MKLVYLRNYLYNLQVPDKKTCLFQSQLSNNVGSENVSHSFEVSDMNRLSIQNIDGDTNVESNVNTTFTAQVEQLFNQVFLFLF